jgi:RHS repeat-associated protein
LITPYGTTTFAYGDVSTDATLPDSERWLEVTDPLGSKERLEYRHDAPGIANSEANFPTTLDATGTTWVVNNYLNYRNSFFWDKKAMMTAPGDYTQAKLIHWLHSSDANAAAGVIESEKEPLESRVWYLYPNQGSSIYYGSNELPISIGRITNGIGEEQVHRRSYNDQGNLTEEINPLGRKTTYAYYLNGIDLKEVRNQTGTLNELLASFTYTDTTHHLVQTATDAAGQVTSFTYNASGQRLTQTVTRGGVQETTTWAYNANGYLQSVTGPLAGAVVSFTYDSLGRLLTVTDADTYTVTYAYDNLNRVTKVTYPDATFEQTLYSNLDAEWVRDRLGQWTHIFHDALRRVTGVTDAAGRTMAYDWCVCGALHGFKDGEGRETKFDFDIQKRLTKKTYADGKTLQYQYDGYRGLLTKRIGGRNQAANYSYNLDNSLAQVTYTDATTMQPLNPPTPTVSYAYDATHSRLTSMTDGTGTTQYGYYPIAVGTLGAGMLATVDGPLANDTLSYTYDELGRRTGSAINGVNDGVTFDALGRVTGASNPLGSFTYGYVNATARLNTITYPVAGMSTSFGYFPNNAPAGTGNGDQRLSSILNQLPGGATASRFDYTYDGLGQLASWTKQLATDPAVREEYLNDPVGELLSATRKDVASGVAQKQYQYGYDKVGNRTLEQVNTTGSAVAAAVHNSVNQVVSRNGGGAMVFEGTVSKPSKVIVGGTNGAGGVRAVLDAANTFRATVPVSIGAQSVEIQATDANGNVTTKHAQVTVTAGTAGQVFTYDDDGNMLSDGTRTFSWDAENRLVKVITGTDMREWVYNGAGLRVARKLNGAVSKQWVWDGTTLREQRDAANNVTRRYYGQGVVQGATLPAAATDKLCYTRDHLGSIRELVDGTGALRARYEYDPYGDRTKLSGTADADLGYTGHYQDVSGSLLAAPFRCYDPKLGRWLSRDPIGEEGGINLYGYVENDPINWIDPFGLREGSPSNLKKRKALNDKANAKDGSDKWAKDKATGKTGAGQWKCSEFVFDTARDAAARIPTLKDKAGNSYYPLANQLGNTNLNLKNWRPLNPGETPEPGDIAVIPNPNGSGHCGIITNNASGNISAHETTVHGISGQFTGPEVVYRRYTGE